MTTASKSSFVLGHRHLLGIEGLSVADISGLLDLSEEFVELNRQVDKKRSNLRGRTQVNLFFEASTRTQSSFEIAGKRLGADVMNMSVASSSIRKGETLMDTAVTLNAMHPDILVVRHHASGAVELLAQKVDGSVINAGDGAHEHPTQALLDALTIRRNKGHIEGLLVAICGDVLHSRVARSNIILLNAMGARVRVVAPSTLLPPGIDDGAIDFLGEQFHRAGGMMAYHQNIRMHGVEGHRRVHQRFALADRGGRDRHIHDVGAEPLACDLERGLRAGGGLEEEVDLGAAAQVAALLVHLPVQFDELFGKVQEAVDIGHGKALDAQQMPVSEDKTRFRCSCH